MSEVTQQTWADLKAAIENLTEEQLNKPIYLWGVESGDKLEFDILDEDYLEDGDEGCAPKSIIEENMSGETVDMTDYPLVHSKGTIILQTDKFLQTVD